MAATKEIIDQQVQEARAGAQDRLRIADALTRNEEKLKQLMDRFNSLMDEGRYTAADAIGSNEVAEIAPDLPIAQSAALVAHETGARIANVQQRNARQKAVVDYAGHGRGGHDSLPRRSAGRLSGRGRLGRIDESAQKVQGSRRSEEGGPGGSKNPPGIENPTTMDFTETPLQDAVDYLKELHNIEIQLDTKALGDAGIAPDTAVTRNSRAFRSRPR